jgi:predicted DNA-binding protein (MmcQ/YjbR family)
MPSKKRTQKQRSPVERLRSVCLSFPEAHEVEAWGEPTFRVKNKMFAMYASSDTHHGGGRPSVWVKSTLVNQDLLVRWQPARYFVPPYVGPSGWIGIYLDKRPSWKTIADIVRDAYLLILPKKLRAKIEK